MRCPVRSKRANDVKDQPFFYIKISRFQDKNIFCFIFDNFCQICYDKIYKYITETRYLKHVKKLGSVFVLIIWILAGSIIFLFCVKSNESIIHRN